MRILIAFGTRPEIIKLGPVYQALRGMKGVEVDVFWTGQHVELADGLLDFFGIEVTYQGRDIVDRPGLAGKIGLMTKQIDQQLRESPYDWIVVQGDTGTATAAAMAGFLNNVRVAHVEAGLRTGDLRSPWPEEFNRRVVSLCAKLHFAPTEGARANLIAEGIPPEKILVVGNSVVDALLYAKKKVAFNYTPKQQALASLPQDKKLVVATLHRRENIGAPMREVLRALRDLGRDGDKLIVLPVHLNPNVRSEVIRILGDASNIVLLPPLQYPDFVYLMSRAWAVVSDSGGIQEEVPAFGIQVLITRETTERPEVIESGFGHLVGSDYGAIVSGVRALTAGHAPKLHIAANPFGSGNAGEAIADAILNHKIRCPKRNPIMPHDVLQAAV